MIRDKGDAIKLYRSIALVLVLATVVSWAASAQSYNAQAIEAGQPHYPDLRTLPPSNLRIVVQGGLRQLNFSNTVWNGGRGPLHLRAVHNNSSNTAATTAVFQGIFSHDANGDWYLVSESQVGLFRFDPDHNHWHFDQFARYEIRNAGPGGSIGDTVLVSSEKVTFCVIDTTKVDMTLEHSTSAAGYSICGQNAVQGLSVGWGDTYPWWISGQSLDATGLQNGTYWLVSTADPRNLLAEFDEGNNTGAVKFRIKNGKLTGPR